VKRTAIACFTLFVSLGSLGCDPSDPPGKPKREDSPVAANEVRDFEKLYGENCAGCHGANGKSGPAPPLNDPLFLSIVPDEEVLTVIKSGRKVRDDQKTSMPAFASDNGGPLNNEQVKALAAGIKEHWKERKSKDVALPPYQAGKEAGRKEEGARVYAIACAGCHGSEGHGGKSGDKTVGALNEQAFVGLISDQALRRIVITGRPDLGMPAFDDRNGRPPEFQPLTSAQIDDVVALLASWRKPATVTYGK
jgi:cytochrome c oxidase cbb3-type subunit III